MTNGIISTEDLAWCAGFFDGEGSTTISKVTGKYYYHFYLKVPQKNPLLLYKFQSIVGGYGKIYLDAKRQLYQLEVGRFEHIQLIICLMWKWLSSIKKEQYKRALLLRLSTGRNPPRFDRKSIYKRNVQKYGSVAAVRRMRMNNSPSNSKPFVNPFEVKNANMSD